MLECSLQIRTIEDLGQTLFPLIENIVASSGGDGDGIIIAENYKELADLYDKWRQEPNYAIPFNQKFGHSLERSDSEKYIHFTEGEETIAFGKPGVELWWTWETVINLEVHKYDQ